MMSQAEALMEVVIWLWKAYEKSGGVLTGSDRVQFLDLFSPVIVISNQLSQANFRRRGECGQEIR